MIEVLSALSGPGKPDRPNEDGFGFAGDFAWVIDGATGLGDEQLTDTPSDAAWLTAVLDETFRENASATDDPAHMLTLAAAAAARRFEAERRRAPRERYEIPTAAALVAHFGRAVTIAELGDCAIHVESAAGLVRFGGTVRGRALEVENARRFMGTGLGRSPEVLEHLRKVRNLINTPEGYPIMAPDPDCARAARRHTVPADAGRALLLSDGFESAIDDYGLHTAASLIEAVAGDADGALAAIRATEEGDADLMRYPRFKQSDDATALLVRFG